MHEWEEVDYTAPSGVPSNAEVMRSYFEDYFNCDRSVNEATLGRVKSLLDISDETYNSLLDEFKPTFEPVDDLAFGSSSLNDLLGL